MPSQTTDHSIPFAIGTDPANTIDDTMEALAERVDELIVAHDAGSLAGRPTSTPGSPGIEGRAYRVNSGAAIGMVNYDTGTGWVTLRDPDPGLFANRPAANTVPAGTHYFTTDTSRLYQSDGTNWTLISDPFFTGTLGARPAASSVPAGSRYRSTDAGDLSESDGTTWFTLTPAAVATFQGRRTSTLALPVGLTQIVGMTFEDLDVGAVYSGGRFTAPVKGLYKLGAFARVATGVSAASWQLMARLNAGSDFHNIDVVNATAATTIRMAGEIFVQMDAGDYYDLYVNNNTSHDGTLQTDTQFRGQLLAQLP